MPFASTRHAAMLAVVISLLSVYSPSAANSTDDAVATANRMVYHNAIQCFVANSYSSYERQKVGDTKKVEAYIRTAKKSYDLAFTVGIRLGRTKKQIEQDMDQIGRDEMTMMVDDPDYLLAVAANCKALGLMN